MVDDAILHGYYKPSPLVAEPLWFTQRIIPWLNSTLTLVTARGKPGPADFPAVKPNLVESEAVNRVIYLNHMTNSRVYIVHLSTREGLKLGIDAIARGDDVIIVRLVPITFASREEVYRSQEGGRFICSFPRGSPMTLKPYGRGLQVVGSFTIGSDHCGFGKDQKDQGRRGFL